MTGLAIIPAQAEGIDALGMNHGMANAGREHVQDREGESMCKEWTKGQMGMRADSQGKHNTQPDEHSDLERREMTW